MTHVLTDLKLMAGKAKAFLDCASNSEIAELEKNRLCCE